MNMFLFKKTVWKIWAQKIVAMITISRSKGLFHLRSTFLFLSSCRAMGMRNGTTYKKK